MNYKPILTTLIIILSSIVVRGQDSAKKYVFIGSTSRIIQIPPMAANLKAGSDTLDIFSPLQIHYIRIDKRIFKIVEGSGTYYVINVK